MTIQKISPVYILLSILLLLLVVEAFAASQGGKDVWLIIKDGGRVLEIPEGVIVRFDGAVRLSYNERGRMRLADGFIVKINGQVVSERQVTRQEGMVQVINEIERTILEIKPGPDARQFWFDSPEVIHLAFSNGHISYSVEEPVAALFWVSQGGLQMRPIPIGRDLGITLEPVCKHLGSHLDLGNAPALVVSDIVAGSMAERSGLKMFDVITRLEGNTLVTQAKLYQMLRQKNPGDRLSVSVLRQAAPLTLALEANGELPDTVWRVQPKAVKTNEPDKGTKTERKTINYEVGLDGFYYYGAGGPEPELVVINSLGELRVQSNHGQLTALLNGSAVPSSRLVREEKLLRVIGESEQTLFAIGILPNHSLIYSADQDPYSLRGKIGVRTGSLCQPVASQLNLDQSQALIIEDISGNSPAALAGLRMFDIITHIDGQPPGNVARMLEIVAAKRVDD